MPKGLVADVIVWEKVYSHKTLENWQ